MINRLIRAHYQSTAEAIADASGTEKWIRGEWLVTNGLGGYASGTMIGVMTRKYHALLVSALPPPYGRTVMFNHLKEELFLDGKAYLLNCEENNDGNLNLEGLKYLKSFYLEAGLPVWEYEVEGVIVEKRIFMIHRQNTVHISYRLLGDKGQRLVLRLHPAFHFRAHEAPVNLPLEENYIFTSLENNRYEIVKKDLTPLRLCTFGHQGTFTLDGTYLNNVFFRTESGRGYEAIGKLWSPGYFQLEVAQGIESGLIASSETWKILEALDPSQAKIAEKVRRQRLVKLASNYAKDVTGEELVLAADQFIITPKSRIEDAVRAHAAGDETCTIIAGYHWFTDWGRDTMISLEGLSLATGRFSEARWILKSFSHYVNQGLIPNMFPEGKNDGLYHTVDATLWFFHAIDRYVSMTQDFLTLEELLPILENIIEWHIKGTLFGIGMDPQDHLIKAGAEGYQLTWMDAKVGDWVVTPRRGKPVEINALWYNALKLMEEWFAMQKQNKKSKVFADLAAQASHSFNQRFWISEKGYLFDVVDGEKGQDDPAFRPNQLFAISLKYPVLEESCWESVVKQCKEKLLTPYGLRTLSPDHPDFKARYGGDLRSRDAAYHQGTVWPWLIGPFIDAWTKVHPEDHRGARRFLEGIKKHLSEPGIGSIHEIFDAVEPYSPQGCIAQAWSVAEALRCWIKTA